jgi:hypothetical protein
MSRIWEGRDEFDDFNGAFNFWKMPSSSYRPSFGPTVYGVIHGWRTVLWSVTSNSEAPSHTGSGYRVTRYFAAFSKPSTSLPEFAPTEKRSDFKDLIQTKLDDGTIERFKSLCMGGVSARSDGNWLFLEAPYWLLNASDMETITRFANAITLRT